MDLTVDAQEESYQEVVNYPDQGTSYDVRTMLLHDVMKNHYYRVVDWKDDDDPPETMYN